MTNKLKIYLLLNFICYILIIFNLLIIRSNLYFKIIDLLDLPTYIPNSQSINMVPFKSIFSIYLNSKYIFTIGIPNLFINTLLLTPIILFISIIFKNLNFIYTILIGFFLSIIIETTQLYLQSGHFDIDDIILNIISALIGYLLYLLLNKNLIYLILGAINLLLLFFICSIVYPHYIFAYALIAFLLFCLYNKVIYNKINLTYCIIFVFVTVISNIGFNFLINR